MEEKNGRYEDMTVEEIVDAIVRDTEQEYNAGEVIDEIVESIESEEELEVADVAHEFVSSDDSFVAEEIEETAESEESGEETNSESRAEKEPKKILMRKILDEDPDELIETRSEKPESGEEKTVHRVKRGVYAVFGFVFSILAFIGAFAVVRESVDYFKEFNSGDIKKESFAQAVYPAVIMDIGEFESPSELTSEQIITASVWSMIMSDGVLDQYQKTFDVVTVPAVDVESYAVKLFGESLPEFQHGTVGPTEARFYYNADEKSYNIPAKPIVFTYSPEVQNVSRDGERYTVTVDYIYEVPEWLEKETSKTAEYVLTETPDGYRIDSMRITSAVKSI